MLDTNAVSHFIRQQPDIVRHILALPMASLCISAITEGELLFGLAKRPQARKLHLAIGEMLRRVDVLLWDRDAARHYGTLRAGLENVGKILGPLDLLIAAHALAAKTVLISSDKVFGHVPGLTIHDWTSPGPAGSEHKPELPPQHRPRCIVYPAHSLTSLPISKMSILLA